MPGRAIECGLPAPIILTRPTAATRRLRCGARRLMWCAFCRRTSRAVRFQQPFTSGLRPLQGLWVYLWVYTSRGTGYWGPPKRFGAPSEITLLRLVLG